eukprot:gene9651-biopygen2911
MLALAPSAATAPTRGGGPAAGRADDRQLREGAEGKVCPRCADRVYNLLVAAGDPHRRADHRLPVRADWAHGTEGREGVVRGDELHDAPVRHDVAGAVRQLRGEPLRHRLRGKHVTKS